MSVLKYTPDGSFDTNNSSAVRIEAGPTLSTFKVLDVDFGTFYLDDYRIYRADGSTLSSRADGIFVDASDRGDTFTLTGGDRGDILRSGSGNDTLNGGAGNDVLEGGAGDNTIDGGGSTSESNTVSYEHYRLSNNFSDQLAIFVTLSGNLADDRFSIEGSTFSDILRNIQNIRGSIYADVLGGDNKNNIIEGGAGGDDIQGGGGIDTASFEHAAAGVLASLTNSAQNTGDAAGDTYRQIENLLGSAYADSLSGDGQDNTLNGGTGADILTGFAGNDTYVVDDLGDTVVEADGFGTDTVLSSISYALSEGQSIETLRLLNSTGNQNLNLTGNEFDQRLIGGNGGNNDLDGGAGADTMAGRDGNDTYHVDNVHDHTIESVGGGTDTVITSVSYNLDGGREIETLEADADAGDINLGGNNLANTLIGNDGDNRLNGRAGADTMKGGDGDDTYTVDDFNDTVVETTDATGGTDTLISTTGYYVLGDGVGVETLRIAASALSKGPAYLSGNEQDQRVIGNAHDNVLDGGGGTDVLQGLGGDDTFQFSAELSSGSVGHVRDFKLGEDTIGLAFKESYSLPTDGDRHLAASAFADVTNSNAGVTEDTRILYNAKTGALSYDADGSGSDAAIHFATLDNHAKIGASDIGLLLIG